MGLSLLLSGTDQKYNEALAKVLLKLNKNYDINIIKNIEDCSSEYFAALINNLGDVNGHVVWKYKYDKDKMNGRYPIEDYNRFIDIRKLNSELMYYWQIGNNCAFGSFTGESNVICIFSGSGGSGKTSFSKALANELSATGDKILYLNAEVSSSQDMYFKKIETYRSISHYIYYLCRECAETKSVESYLMQDENGIYYFNLGSGINELTRLENKAMFLNSISSSINIDWIIVDLDVVSIKELTEWQAVADFMVMIGESTEISYFKNSMLTEQLYSFCDAADINLIQIINKCKKYSCDGNNETFLLPFEEESFQIKNDVININSDNNYGMGVRNVANRIRFS